MCDVRREENSEEYVEIIEFDDGSTLKIPEIWKECAKLKYGMEWPEYWSKFKEVVDNLWTNGRVLTKFGEGISKEHSWIYPKTLVNRTE